MKLLDWLFGSKDAPGRAGFDSGIYRDPIKAPKVQIRSSAPAISGSMICHGNTLSSLEGAPMTVGGSLDRLKFRQELVQRASQQMVSKIDEEIMSKYPPNKASDKLLEVSDKPLTFREAYVKILTWIHGI